jgi:hypothetical protein
MEERRPPKDAKFAAQRAGAVPPSATIGAWRIAAGGEIVGKFTPNPNYRPKPN